VQRDDRTVGLEMGADDDLAEPSSPDELHSKLEAAIRDDAAAR